MTTAWKLPPLRQGRPADDRIRAHRVALEEGIASRQNLHAERAHVPRSETLIGGVLCLDVGDRHARATVIFLHGGGFSLGHPSMSLRYGARIAEEAQVRVILPRYRLAPEHPFPAALHDVVAVFAAIHEESGDRPIIVMGVSAGANLTAALLAAAAASGQPYPSAAIAISAVTDFVPDAATYDTHALVDKWVSRDSMRLIADTYLQGHLENDPLASPIHADMSGYPPIQLFCGGQEVLLDDTLRFARKLALANRVVEAQFVTDAEHGWMFIDPASPAAAQATAHILRFIRDAADAGTVSIA